MTIEQKIIKNTVGLLELARSTWAATRRNQGINKNPEAYAGEVCRSVETDCLGGWNGVRFLYMAPEFEHLEKLPLAERIQLVEDLWDSIAQDQGADLPVPDWQKAELARRREAYARDPDSARPWSEVKRSILESQG